ncbi:carboxypeptidase-like regulatory domain-containing protein [Carboxylicivirga sp. M1479]|uniref:carboxypeptidase-like regulatory domain-containing protein n=1 Tax=Carboxylicivirga sp. M1479 TaxID=2594476 RepID=UPI0011781477|nr:carboxypeptidase-like regulatory domain-containing protein [Carboxylicivirga sp. M1479]TRX71011.1 carboxypeptidase-like regulatory domain-containing protein [Carboxylicivirga sp. M1479]
MRARNCVLVAMLLCLSSILLAQSNHGEHTLIGKVVTEDSTSVVPFAFVASNESGLGKETNENGCFKLNTSVGDTLFFRSLGYEDALLLVDEPMLSDTLIWQVKAKSYELASVDVLMFRSYASFRSMVANMDIMEDKSSMNMSFMLDVRHLGADLATAGSSYSQAGSGINLLAIPKLIGSRIIHTKEGLTHEENSKLYERYNQFTTKENLRSFTKLDDEDLDAFIVFLRSKHKIDPHLSDYKMMEAIGMVLNQFLALKEDTTHIKN